MGDGGRAKRTVQKAGSAIFLMFAALSFAPYGSSRDGVRSVAGVFPAFPFFPLSHVELAPRRMSMR